MIKLAYSIYSEFSSQVCLSVACPGLDFVAPGPLLGGLVQQHVQPVPAVAGAKVLGEAGRDQVAPGAVNQRRDQGAGRRLVVYHNR